MGILYPANSAIFAPRSICFCVNGVFFILEFLESKCRGKRFCTFSCTAVKKYAYLRMRFTLIFLLSALCIRGFAQSEERLLKKGDSLVNVNKVNDAIILYTKALKANPKSEKA